MALARREFIQVVVVAGAGAVIGACGGSDDSSDGTGGGGGGAGNCSANGGTASAISGNHGHTLSIPAADFGDGQNHTYSIAGSGDHDHQVALSAAQLATILGGGSVSVTSSAGGSPTHSHGVTCVCA